MDLLLEGGVAGHMSHLYDNPSLTFTKMKEILKAAADGGLEGTEKTDGQNLFISYNVNTGEAKAARNKGNIKSGGLNASELASKFAGRGNLEIAFNEAFSAFERAVELFSNEEKVEIFGADTNIYYNAEIQDPRSANVINYDYKTFNIHRAGGGEFDRETGAKTDKDISARAIALEIALARIEKQLEGEHRVQMNAIRKLEKLTDDTIIHNTLTEIEKVISDAGISDNQTVGDYTIARLIEIIEKKVELSDETLRLLLKRMLKVKGVGIRDVLKTLGPEEDKVAIVRELVADASNHLKNAIAPLEDVVHDFTVDILKALDSAFVIDNRAEVERLRGEVNVAIQAIEGSGRDDAMEILQRQMKKLKNIDNVSTAAEGFVFDYDGYTYKFTGNFAPINQILGLFKYGRGKVPPMQKLEEDEEIQIIGDENIKKVIGIYPGRFQPMGRHHAAVYNQLLNNDFLDDVYVVTSNVVKPPKSPFNFEEKKQIAAAHGIPEDKVIQVKNPYIAEEILRYFNPDTTAAVFVVGEKDRQRLKGDFFRPWEGTAEVGYEDGAYTMIAPHESIDIPGYGEMSGTSIRDALASGDMELFKQIMGTDFDSATAEMILNKLRVEIVDDVETVEIVERVEEVEIVETIYPENRNLSSKKISYLTKIINDVIIEEKKKKFYDIDMLYGDDVEEADEEELEEISGAGAVGGYSGPRPFPKDENIEEDQLVEGIYNYLLSKVESIK